tara:strand:+ start:6369 stop:6551 length:183 start_codon:yes stop_codon:yes gene_type:complete
LIELASLCESGDGVNKPTQTLGEPLISNDNRPLISNRGKIPILEILSIIVYYLTGLFKEL